jgi:hypothetical protein
VNALAGVLSMQVAPPKWTDTPDVGKLVPTIVSSLLAESYVYPVISATAWTYA